MFLLIRKAGLASMIRRFFFTFHNVSINTGDASDNLYCFFTLHSTMFLLIRNSLHHAELHWRTLHSTMFLLIRPRPWTWFRPYWSLHSTMFLLILRKVPMEENISNFTFHNVSINTSLGGSGNYFSWLYIPQCFY